MADRRGLIQTCNFPRTFGSKLGTSDEVAATDPDFASVVLLLDFAGAHLATNITDLSDASHDDETFTGGSVIRTDNQYLLKNSLQPLGYIWYPDHADWDLPGDFTIEAGVYWPDGADSRGIISNWSATEGFGFQSSDAGGGDTNLNLILNGTNVKTEAFTIVHSTWYHVAWCRDGTNLRLFLDGVQLGTPTTNSTSIVSTKQLNLGILGAPATQVFAGQMGAVRITKGVARYTANFTPPSSFYPTS